MFSKGNMYLWVKSPFTRCLLLISSFRSREFRSWKVETKNSERSLSLGILLHHWRHCPHHFLASRQKVSQHYSEICQVSVLEPKLVDVYTDPSHSLWVLFSFGPSLHIDQRVYSPVLFNGTKLLPPATTLNYVPWSYVSIAVSNSFPTTNLRALWNRIVGFIFQYLIRR